MLGVMSTGPFGLSMAGPKLVCGCPEIRFFSQGFGPKSQILKTFGKGKALGPVFLLVKDIK